jgi:hypothetical protein
MTGADPSKVTVVGDVLEDERESAVSKSATALWKLIRESKRGAAPIGPAGPTTTTFGEAIWPVALGATETPNLRLLPLSRLGAAEGFSGNRVLIGYFTLGGMMPSRPMVVKISEAGKVENIAKEYNSAIAVRKYALYNPGEFALPLFCHLVDNFGILWSPFSSNLPILQSHEHSPSRLNLGIEDLWIHLRAQAGAPYPPVKDIDGNLRTIDFVETINAVYDLLKPLHSRGGITTTIARSLVDEYDWYLRDFEAWCGELCRIWGPKVQRNIEVDGRARVNPLWVMERIRELPPVNLRLGAVQGDMHPRNVVISARRSPHIIDFGWAADDSHAIKDFVLFECNLRFMVMQPLLSKRSVEAFASFITPDDPKPDFTDDGYCKRRFEMLLALRERACDYVDDATNLRRWHEQYTIPLFLVALGLQKFLREADCQMAALATVLALAERITRDVLDP